MGSARQRMRTLVAGSGVLALIAACLLLVPATEASPHYKRCHNVIIRNSNGSVFTQTNGLFVARGSCRLARRLARRYLSFEGEGRRPTLGFKCSGGSDGVACHRNGKRVTWGYYYD